MNRPLFLRLVLVDSLFCCALVAGWFAYPHVHWAAVVAIVAVLLAFAAGAVTCLFLAWTGRRGRLLNDVGELAERLPGLALLGTASGFMIALSGDAAGVQHRIAGASTGIAATFVGVAAWLVLGLQHRMIARGEEA